MSKKKLKKLQKANRILGITEQLQNVKNQFAATSPAAEIGMLPVSTVVEHIDSRADFPRAVEVETKVEVGDSEESWADDEDDNDGGAIPVPQALPTSAPVETIAPVLTQVETAPQANVSPQENKEVKPEANQESSTMNVVNHPTHTASIPAISNVAATVSEGIVAESAMEQMQYDANTEPPAAKTAQPESVVESAPVKKQSAAFHHLATTLLITLDLTNFGHMTNLKSVLSRAKLDGQEFNMYSPFRKAGKKTEVNPSAEGVVRYALSDILDMTDTVNNSRLMILGSDEEVENKIRGSVETMCNQIVNLFPANMDHVVASLLDEENERTLQLQVKDLVNVRSWVNFSADVATEEGGSLIGIHNAVIHVTVNAGMLYDTEDRLKYIGQVEKLIQMMVEKREEANTTILFGLMLESSTLSDASMRATFDAMLAGDEYILYSAKEMHKLETSDFMPQTHEEIDTKVLTPNGDMVLFRLLTDSGDEEETEETAADEPAE